MALTAGCGSVKVGGGDPSKIDLRMQIDQKDDEIRQLQRTIAGHVQRIYALEASATTVPTLPQDRLGRLFTTTGLNITRLTLGQNYDPDKPGDEGFKVAFVPVDQFGQEFKAAGRAKIELFDLSAKEPRLGEWSFATPELMPMYFTTVLLSSYIVEVKQWQTPPTSPKLLVKVTFTEELTGRTVEAQRELTVTPPTVK